MSLLSDLQQVRGEVVPSYYQLFIEELKCRIRNSPQSTEFYIAVPEKYLVEIMTSLKEENIYSHILDNRVIKVIIPMKKD